MKTLIQVSMFVAAASLALGHDDRDTVKLPRAQYLDETALEVVVQGMQNMQYPVARFEFLKRLGLAKRGLPTVVHMDQTSQALRSSEFETISLTDAAQKGKKFSLLLWYDPNARKLSGESFAKSKVIIYAQMIMEDDGSKEAPKAVYILESARYPYTKLDGHRRTLK